MSFSSYTSEMGLLGGPGEWLGEGISASLRPWVGGGLGLVASLILTRIVLRVAEHRDWVAHPTDDRWHDRPVALMGGLALFCSVAIGVGGSGMLSVYPWPVSLGATLVFAVGLADDLWGTRPQVKLVVQIAATALLLLAGYAFWRGGPFWVSIPLTFLWVIGITNAVNLIDGLDGLAAGITVVAGAVFALIGSALENWGVATTSLVLVGTSLGFLVYNTKPARIFMGDCGSLFLGYMLALVALDGQSTGGPLVSTLVPVVVLAVPIFDTTFVTVTRMLSGRHVTEGGNDHTHHRLVHLGLSERGAVTALCGMSGIFGGMALAILWSTVQLFLAVVLLGLVVASVFALYLAESRSYDPPTVRRDPAFTERFGAVMQALAGGFYWKSVAGIVADMLLVVAAFIIAIHLRFGWTPPPEQLDFTVQVLPWIVVLKVGLFYAFGLYHGIWRYAGTPEIFRLVKASTLSSVLALGAVGAVFGVGTISVRVLVLDWMITTGAVGGIRLAFRALRQYFAALRDEGRRVLVYGSGQKEMLLLRHLCLWSDPNRTVVGLLDGDEVRHGLRMQGVKVLGDVGDLPEIARRHDVDEVIMPMHDGKEADRKRVASMCARMNLPCQYFSVDLQPVVGTDQALPASAGDGGLPSS